MPPLMSHSARMRMSRSSSLLITKIQKKKQTCSNTCIQSSKATYDLVVALTSTVTELKQICASTSASLAELAIENAKLHDKVSELNCKLDKSSQVSGMSQDTLLIGDSLLRDIDQQRLHNTKVVSIGGAKAHDALDKIMHTDEKYAKAIICIGTNNCGNESMDYQEVSETYKKLITAMTQKVPSSKDIILSSIPPRSDDIDSQERVQMLNATLCSLAADSGVVFIDNDSNFLLRDGSPNDGYLLADGLHLSAKGTNKLAKNLKLEVVSKFNGNVVKPKKSPNKQDKPTQSFKTTAPVHSASVEPKTVQNIDTGHCISGPSMTVRAKLSRPASQRTTGIGHLHHLQTNGHDAPRHSMSRVSPESSPKCFNEETSANNEWQTVRRNRTHHKAVYKNNLTGHQHGAYQGNGSRLSSSYYSQSHSCHYCGESNHTSRNCRYGEPVPCYSCGESGHKQKFCNSH